MRELDNLSNPVGVIKESEILAAELFESDNAFFLVNGSTSGVQNMIMSAVNPGEKIILPRNIHKSAINGLILLSPLRNLFINFIQLSLKRPAGTRSILPL